MSVNNVRAFLVYALLSNYEPIPEGVRGGIKLKCYYEKDFYVCYDRFCRYCINVV